MIYDITDEVKYDIIEDDYIQIIQCICKKNIKKNKIMLDSMGYNYCPECHRRIKMKYELHIYEIK